MFNWFRKLFKIKPKEYYCANCKFKTNVYLRTNKHQGWRCTKELIAESKSMYRFKHICGIRTKVKTSPKWCPLKK